MALGYYIITTKIPAYLYDNFKMPISSNGSLTALTAAGITISKLLCIPLSFYLTNLKMMSLTNLRKVFQTIAMLMPAISLFILTLKSDSQTLGISLIFLAMFGMGEFILQCNLVPIQCVIMISTLITNLSPVQFLGFICLGETPICAEFAKDLSGCK